MGVNMQFKDIDSAYNYLCKEIYGGKVDESLGKIYLEDIQFSFEIDKLFMPYHLSRRNIDMSTLFGRLLWQFNDQSNLNIISKFDSQIKLGCMIANEDMSIIDKMRVTTEQLWVNQYAALNLHMDYIPNSVSFIFELDADKYKLSCKIIEDNEDLWFSLPYNLIYYMELIQYIAHSLEVDGISVSIHYFVHNIYMHLHNMPALIDNSSSITFNFDRIQFHSIRSNVYAMLTEINEEDLHKETIEMAKKYFKLEVKHES